MKKRPVTVLIFIILCAALFVSVVFTVSIGAVKIAPDTVYRMLYTQLTAGNAIDSGLWTRAQYHIVWDIRLPRVFMGVAAGAGLAMCGAAMQALVLNPIADPFILGVSSGASAGAALALLSSLSFYGGASLVSLMAFLGALLASALVYSMSRVGGGFRILPVALLLSGTAINAVMGAVTSLLIFLAKSPESIATVYYWQMGSIASAQWKTLPLPLIAVGAGGVGFCLCAAHFNLMMLGDEDAAALGIHVNRFRTAMMFVVAFMVASLVSVTGVIGFIGLMVPHLVRMLFRTSDNLIIIPGSALLGALYLIWADTGARRSFGSTEVPLGIITACVGAPFFVFLLIRRRMTGQGA
jgi:iron complex transport system permease protein